MAAFMGWIIIDKVFFFFFPLFPLPLKIMLTIQIFKIIFLVIGILTLINILLIFNFYSWFFFCKNLICFNFIIQSQLMIYYFF